MGGCAAFDPSGAYVANMLGFVDCQALGLAQAGYVALGAGSTFGTALGGLLVVAVALFGWRLLLGEGGALRAGAVLVLRLGMVLALASQWAAFQPLVYDLVTQGPQELAGLILPPMGLGGEDSAGLAARVQGVSSALADLAEPSPVSVQAAGQAGNVPPPVPLLPEDGRKVLASANAVLVVAALGGMVAVRVVVALLLALAPLFVAGLLFEATWSLFAGWLRVLAGAALGAVAVPLVLLLELAVIEPQILALRAVLAGGGLPGGPTLQLPTQIWVTVTVFALGLVAALLAVARATAALQLPVFRCVASFGGQASATLPAGVGGAVLPLVAALAPAHAAQPRSRAQAIADAAQAMARRDGLAEGGLAGPGQGQNGLGQNGRGGSGAWLSAPQILRHSQLPPLGQGGRRSQPRASLGASRRDQQT